MMVPIEYPQKEYCGYGRMTPKFLQRLKQLNKGISLNYCYTYYNNKNWTVYLSLIFKVKKMRVI